MMEKKKKPKHTTTSVSVTEEETHEFSEELSDGGERNEIIQINENQ
jgi:hypothetical protein